MPSAILWPEKLNRGANAYIITTYYKMSDHYSQSISDMCIFDVNFPILLPIFILALADSYWRKKCSFWINNLILTCLTWLIHTSFLPSNWNLDNFFAICTWPNSPVRAKNLSRLQFEGKNDLWISQVRRVKAVLGKSKVHKSF